MLHVSDPIYIFGSIPLFIYQSSHESIAVGPWRATESRYTWTSPWRRPRKTTPKRRNNTRGSRCVWHGPPGSGFVAWTVPRNLWWLTWYFFSSMDINGHEKLWFYVRKLQWKWVNMVILCDFTWDTCYVVVGEMWDTSGNLTVCCGNTLDFYWKNI